MTASREKILEALRTRSLPEASECQISLYHCGFDCRWPYEEANPFWAWGRTPAEAHSAMIEKIEHALKESK